MARTGPTPPSGDTAGIETQAERVRRFAEEANALQLPYRVGGGEGRDTTFGATAPAADPASEPKAATS